VGAFIDPIPLKIYQMGGGLKLEILKVHIPSQKLTYQERKIWLFWIK
jgi:hypothetical protein